MARQANGRGRPTQTFERCTNAAPALAILLLRSRQGSVAHFYCSVQSTIVCEVMQSFNRRVEATLHVLKKSGTLSRTDAGPERPLGTA